MRRARHECVECVECVRVRESAKTSLSCGSIVVTNVVARASVVPREFLVLVLVLVLGLGANDGWLAAQKNLLNKRDPKNRLMTCCEEGEVVKYLYTAAAAAAAAARDHENEVNNVPSSGPPNWLEFINT